MMFKHRARIMAQINRKLNRYINRQLGVSLTDLFNKSTEKVDEKWQVTPKAEQYLGDYFHKKLHDHTLLESRRKNKKEVHHLLKGKSDFEARERAAKALILKSSLISSVKGGGAAAAGTPFTLLETVSMLNSLWRKLEVMAELFDIEPYSGFEKAYLLGVLTLGLTDQKQLKIQTYRDLTYLEMNLLETSLTLKQQDEHSFLMNKPLEASQAVIRPLVSKKLTQTIPVIGLGLGSITNGTMLQQCLQVGYLVYAKRFLLGNEKK